MRVLITGGTGFIGSMLLEQLSAAGHHCVVLTRMQPPPAGPATYLHSLDELSDDAEIDAVVNLAGASLADKRWSAGYKKMIVDSRLQTTAALVALCRRLTTKPAVFLSGSAIGYYGAHADELVDESTESGEGFAAQLCCDWEKEASAIDDLGIRLCVLRLGVVLDRDGGAFVEMARPFRLGIANWIGSGDQYLSWIHRRDAVGAMLFLLEQAQLRGVFNLTAPQPVTSKSFCTLLQAQLRTWVSLPMPAWVMRMLVGEMADELLVQGQRVVPRNLLQAGFQFQYASLEEALPALV